MQIKLCSIEEPLAVAFEKHCGHFAFVEVVRGSILDLEVDAVVSPANSFGFMDGGIDMAYSLHFGWDVQERLQGLIEENYSNGELLVGQAEVVSTENKAIPFVVAAPTMRTPTVLPDNTLNPYLAARAALLAWQPVVDADGPYDSIAFPGMGTGVGRVDPDLCAHQIKMAIDFITNQPIPFPSSLGNACERKRMLYPDYKGRQHERPT